MLWALLVLSQVVGPPAPAPPDSQPARKARVGLIAFGGETTSAAPKLAERTLRKLAEPARAFEVAALLVEAGPASKAALSGALRAETLKDLGALVLCTAPGAGVELDEAARKALVDAVHEGLALIALGATIETFPDWKEFSELLGARADGTPWTATGAPVSLKVEDRAHPATAAIGAMWLMQENIYQFTAPYDRQKLHVLMSVDAQATDMSAPTLKRSDGDYAVAWARIAGKGRVLYTTLGMRAETWNDELFQQHLLGAVRWGLGQLPGRPLVDEQGGTLVAKKSGLEYRDLFAGFGEPVQRGHTAVIHYVGYLLDGTKFESTIDRAQPLTFWVGMGDTLRAFDEGVPGMRVGGRRKLIAPPGLAYGLKGLADKVPPNATVIFEVELLEIKE
jgi:type 1 glutamine amidotransferase